MCYFTYFTTLYLHEGLFYGEGFLGKGASQQA